MTTGAPMELVNLHSAATQVAAQRSRLYQLLAAAFAFPDEDFFDDVQDGTFASALARLCDTLPYDLTGVATLGLGAAGESYADFEAEYIRLFDVGAAGPPCPLYGGVYIGDRMKVMEDATRFYNFFSLRISPQLRELPDHITTELEFLHYLTFREAEARQHGLDPAPLRRAQRDFLARHLCKWVPRLHLRLAKQTTLPFFPALVRFAAAFVEHDQAYAAAAAAQASGEC
jgi:DMSO reductase family type II enzyme chaperone